MGIPAVAMTRPDASERQVAELRDQLVGNNRLYNDLTKDYSELQSRLAAIEKAAEAVLDNDEYDDPSRRFLDDMNALRAAMEKK
jgi:hypothetical protein